MSQNSIVVNDGTGVQVLSAINNALDTIHTLHAGSAAPSELVIGMLWADTTASLLKRLASTGPAVWTTLGTLAANFGMLRIDGSNQMTGPLDEKSASPASAATLDVSGGNFQQVTGSTTISALSTAQAGACRCLRFTSALTITHNATSLILPAGQSINAAAGDVAEFHSLGSGNWVLTDYLRADGSVMEIQAPDLAVANGLTNLAGTIGNYVVLANTSGAKTITSLGTAPAGTRKAVTFSVTGGASVLITCNATSLVIPGKSSGQTLGVGDGDSAVFHSLGSGNWRMTGYQPNTLTSKLWTVTPVSTDFTASAADNGKWFSTTKTSAMTITVSDIAALPADFVVAFNNANTNSAALTITCQSGQTIDGAQSAVLGVGSTRGYIRKTATELVALDNGIASANVTYAKNSTLNGAGSWTVPANTYIARFTVIGNGGGGGGAGLSPNYGSGGGGGGFAQKIFNVLPGQVYTATFGALGAGGASGVAGTSGGSVSIAGVAGTITATGGGGGAADLGAGGTGGGGSGGTTNITGGIGGGGASGSGAGGGGSAPGQSGGANNGSNGSIKLGAPGSMAPGGDVGSNGGISTGKESGGGGGGASGAAAGGAGGNAGGGGGGGGTGRSGGAGALGRVFIEW